jgi:hypothetical protein
MSIKKIEVNIDKDYRIKLEDGRYVRKGYIFPAGSLLESINPAIKKRIDKEGMEVESFDPIIDLQFKKNAKAEKIRAERNKGFVYQGTLLSMSDLTGFIPTAIDISNGNTNCLPIPTKGDLIIETADQIKEITNLYSLRMKEFQVKLKQCIDAKTIKEIEAVEVI